VSNEAQKLKVSYDMFVTWSVHEFIGAKKTHIIFDMNASLNKPIILVYMYCLSFSHYCVWWIRLYRILGMKLQSFFIGSNVPSNFLKSVCTQNFLCGTFYYKSSILRTTCMKYVRKTFFKGKFMCSPSLLVCAHPTTCVRVHMCTA